MPMTSRRSSLWSSSVLLLSLIAALDSADKQLLAASFPALETTLHLSVETLGYFSLFTNLSYALSLPLWGWLVHKYGIEKSHLVLAASCFVWGAATFCIALFGNSIVGQAFFRVLNGVSLASILPLTQTMLVELVPPHQKGRAFGILGWMEKAAGTLAVSSMVWCKQNWWIPYSVVAVLSMLLAPISAKMLQINSVRERNIPEEEERLSFMQILRRISKIPTFLCLVAQGCFGGVPWDMMSFCLLLLEWRDFTKEQVVLLQFTSGISGTIGGALGGVLGDYFGGHNPQGRVAIGFASVVLAILFFNGYIFSTNFYFALLSANLFHVTASWTPAAALRPICADLARNPSERAQIVAFWILLEKTSSAVFGAPLVGYLTKHMLEKENDAEPVTKARALSFNLSILSTFFWGVCALIWIVMARTVKGLPPPNDHPYRKDSKV